MSKPVTLPAIPVYPKELKNFVDTYEEKRKITLELESLEKQAQKGKIPRRQYKVRRRTLESRLAVLSRDLAMLREKIRTVGARYADLMRQIEVAEAEMQAAEAEIRRTEVRYRRGEIAASVYRELLEGSYKRREKAKTTIDGVLLRLKEHVG
jgi:chromosome segregation ATPase